jgi:hypothetical protein
VLIPERQHIGVAHGSEPLCPHLQMGGGDLAVRILDDGVVAIAGDADLLLGSEERALGERHGQAGYQNPLLSSPAGKRSLDTGRAWSDRCQHWSGDFPVR